MFVLPVVSPFRLRVSQYLDRAAFPAPATSNACDHPHRYLFTVFAVKADKLDVKVDTSAAVVGFNLHFNRLAEAKIMGLFKR